MSPNCAIARVCSTATDANGPSLRRDGSPCVARCRFTSTSNSAAAPAGVGAPVAVVVAVGEGDGACCDGAGLVDGAGDGAEGDGDGEPPMQTTTHVPPEEVWVSAADGAARAVSAAIAATAGRTVRLRNIMGL